MVDSMRIAMGQVGVTQEMVDDTITKPVGAHLPKPIHFFRLAAMKLL
ncbi:MAG: hypothetical protein K2X48_05285 [Chitinophagaceae bacterium]|nr:hypothetical protein [Chitinophagaceae bacterium]